MSTESRELRGLLASLMHPGLKAIDLSLRRMHWHLSAIGSPERHLPPVVHVAGTNGKGSTIAFLRAMLEAANYRCHVFTSPHLVHFKERIVVSGAMFEEPELIERLSAVKARGDEYPLTFFEANTVVALEAFAQIPADVTLLEVGMGGRFDATNVVDEPALCIITPIAMDHQTYLGDTLGKIAYEKAGIIKPNVPVVVAPQSAEAMQVIEQVAIDKNAPIIRAQPLIKQPLGLFGAHQAINAGVAKQAANILHKHGFNALNEAAVNIGLRQVKWPGRLQHLREGPLLDMAAEGTDIWLDGGHNAQAGQMLSEWAREQKKPVYLICAMSEGKDPAAFLAPFEGVVQHIYCTEIPGESLSLAAQNVLNQAKNAELCASPEAAIRSLPADSIALIVGSLYLAGYVLQKNR